MRKLDHCNIVRLRYFFYSSGEKVNTVFPPSSFFALGLQKNQIGSNIFYVTVYQGFKKGSSSFVSVKYRNSSDSSVAKVNSWKQDSQTWTCRLILSDCY